VEDIMMTRKLVVAALTGVLAAGALNAPARAQCVAPVLICFSGDNYAYETPNNPTYISVTGSPMTVVGKIVSFDAASPLGFLNANMPAKEYTFVWTLVTIAPGTTETILGRQWVTNYASAAQLGTFNIYEDSTPDAPTTPALLPNPPSDGVPGNFSDGTLILSASINFFRVIVSKNSQGNFGGSFSATANFTGGTLFPLIGGNVFNFGTTWITTGTAVGQTTALPAGFSALVSGKTDSPTAVQGSTWGAIKMLYR
jgi:hypothetical protein